MIRLCHVSDNHSLFAPLVGKFEAVVHSGDFFPNSNNVWTSQIKELEFQYQWLRDNLPVIKDWLQGNPFLFTLGNHDFVDGDYMAGLLNSIGIEAYNLADRVTTFQRVNFYGFPWIPYIQGNWSYECTVSQMQPHIDRMVETLNQTYVEVIVAHSPMYGTLDFSKHNICLGSTQLANAFDLQIEKNMMPLAYLCGHIHEARGVSMRNGMLVLNSATTQNVIEI